VILLYGADPTDPPNEFLAEAINHLIKDIPNVNDQVAFYERGDGVIVHSKVTIIDDEWTSIGSANCMRRSLYTDGECSIGVLDDSTPPFAKLLRKDLWGEHCGLAPDTEDSAHPRDVLLDLTSALGIWNATWGAPGVHLRPELQKMKIPFEYASPPGPGQWEGTTAPAFDQQMYDLQDADSSKEF
jgi:phosphatidylserine/phosphatidylglycerophosphate/cardiolipin synthase-like enzyme